MTRRGNAASTTVPPSANVAERRTWVAKHLTMGHRPTAVAQMGAVQFGVDEHTIMRDLAAVRDQWAAEAAEERPRARRLDLRVILGESPTHAPAPLARSEDGRGTRR